MLQNAKIVRLHTAPSIMPVSIDLHVKCPFYKKRNKKKSTFFFSPENFHMVLGEQIAISCQIFKSGSNKKKSKCPEFTKVPKFSKLFQLAVASALNETNVAVEDSRCVCLRCWNTSIRQ